MNKLILILTLVCTFFLMACSQNNINKKKYIGEWVSVESENLGNGTFGIRYFNIEKDNWEIRFTLYLDSAQTLPVFEFRGTGPYTIEGESSVVDGDNAIFYFDKKYLTILTEDSTIIQNFGFSNCAATVGVEKDITDTGCSFLESKTACAQEYDILKIENDQLYFGARPSSGNLCTENARPTTWNTPLKEL